MAALHRHLGHPQDRSGDAGAVVLAAGRGERLGCGPKALVRVGGVPLVRLAVNAVTASRSVLSVVVVAPVDALGLVEDCLAGAPRGVQVRVVAGGDTRSDSVRCGLRSLPADAHWVAVAEAARPFFGAELVDRILDQLRARSGSSAGELPCGGVPMVRVADSLHRVGPASILAGCVDRDQVQAAQTPQVVRRECLLDAYSVCGATTGLNDEASLVTRAGGRMLALPGVVHNMKITYDGDVELAEAIHQVAPTGFGRERL